MLTAGKKEEPEGEGGQAEEEQQKNERLWDEAVNVLSKLARVVP